MISLERETQVFCQGKNDALACVGPRGGEYETVSEQLAYLRGYRRSGAAVRV